MQRRQIVEAMSAIVLAAVATGCGGGEEVDIVKAERFIRDSYAKGNPFLLPANSVDCPDEVPREVGGTFTCEITKSNGETATITVHMLEDRLRYSADDIEER